MLGRAGFFREVAEEEVAAETNKEAVARLVRRQAVPYQEAGEKAEGKA